MRIFRLSASLLSCLNAFRGNVLDISLRFRIPPFSTIVRPRRAVPPCSPLPTQLHLASFRFPSRLASRLIPFRLFPSSLPSNRPVAFLDPSIVSCGVADGGAGRRDPLY